MTNDADFVATEELLIETADGFKISASLFARDAPSICVLASSGTGFAKEFYVPLARHLAGRGAAVLVYDYRGIASSQRSGQLLTADLPDWGRLDMSAAVGYLRAAYPGTPITQLGHSAGGHLAGFATNHDQISRHAFVACGGGTWYKHAPGRWPLELYFWWILGPYSLARWGHVKSIGGWTGRALPGPAFRTWRRWSHRSQYYLRELQSDHESHCFEQLVAPIRSWIFTDDGIATPKTAKDILEAYPNAKSEIIVRSPQHYGKRKIGHQGSFRPGFEALWDEWWDWLSEGT